MSLHEVKNACVDVCFLVQGMLDNNVYFISDGEGTMVVDPSCDANEIMAARLMPSCSRIAISTMWAPRPSCAA